MIRTLGVGIWVCLVTIGAMFGALEWQKSQGVMHEASGTSEVKLAEVKTKAINVPIIDDGAVQGYMIAQFVVTVDDNVAKKLGVDPQIYLLDEAFKTIYAGERINLKQLKKQDLPALAKSLGENVNKRLNQQLVQDVLIEQIAYVPKKEIREPPK